MGLSAQINGAPIRRRLSCRLGNQQRLTPVLERGAREVPTVDLFNELAEPQAAGIAVTLEKNVLIRPAGFNDIGRVVENDRIGDVFHLQHALASKRLQALVVTLSRVPGICNRHRFVPSPSQSDAHRVVIRQVLNVLAELVETLCGNRTFITTQIRRDVVGRGGVGRPKKAMDF